MDVEIPVLAGVLTIPTQTGFSLNRISKKVKLLYINHTLNYYPEQKKKYKRFTATSLIKSVYNPISISITLSLL